MYTPMFRSMNAIFKVYIYCIISPYHIVIAANTFVIVRICMLLLL
jgi:hypothetical protein